MSESRSTPLAELWIQYARLSEGGFGRVMLESDFMEMMKRLQSESTESVPPLCNACVAPAECMRWSACYRKRGSPSAAAATFEDINGEFNAVLNASSWEECRRRIVNSLAPAVRAAIGSRSATGSIPDEFKVLGSYYNVDDVAALIRAQDEHVTRLQAKLPPVRDTTPGRVREG